VTLHAWYRLLFITLIVLGLWIVAWATGVTGRFTPENIRSVLAGRGLYGVIVFIVIFSAGQLLRVPSFVFVTTAVIVYGKNTGILVALLGAMMSATVSFTVVRAFAGHALADVQHPLIKRLLRNLDSHPVQTVALLRLIFQTAPPLNYALPMTAVRWRDHFVGSVVGLPAPVALMAAFVDWVLHRTL
jgi:uncharacterized membrane protein YdjX (TVP38/TMEM64 family)